MKSNFCTVRDRRKELSKLPHEELEELSSIHFQFNDEASRSVRQKIRRTKELALEILESRLVAQSN